MELSIRTLHLINDLMFTGGCIYFSAEINIYSSAEICKFQKRNIYIPEQKYMFQYRVLSQYRNKYSSTELYLSTEIALPGSRLKYFPRPLCGPTHAFENGGLLWKVWLYASKIIFSCPKCGDKIPQVGTISSVSSRAATT